MKATWNGAVLADSDKTITIEGNQYFPAGSLKSEHFVRSDRHSTCHWKGEASYYSIKVGDDLNHDAAWYYPEPKDGSQRIAGHDFTNYVAFWNGVTVEA